ncbi:MAG: hypothetical protein ACTHLC_19695 [Rhizobiaceae bacterium]
MATAEQHRAVTVAENKPLRVDPRQKAETQHTGQLSIQAFLVDRARYDRFDRHGNAVHPGARNDRARLSIGEAGALQYGCPEQPCDAAATGRAYVIVSNVLTGCCRAGIAPDGIGWPLRHAQMLS